MLYSRKVPLKKYYFRNTDALLKFIKVTFKNKDNLKNITLVDYDYNYKIDSYKELENTFEQLSSFWSLSFEYEDDNSNIEIRIYELDNLRQKSNITISATSLEETKKKENEIIKDLNHYKIKYSGISNPSVQFIFCFVLAVVLLSIFNMNFPTVQSNIVDYFIVSLGIVSITFIAIFSLNLILFPTFKIKVRKSILSRFKNYINNASNSQNILFSIIIALVIGLLLK